MHTEYETAEQLRQLLVYEKKIARHARLTAWVSVLLALVLLAVLVLAVPKAVLLAQGAEDALERVKDISDAAEELVVNANTMVLKNTDAVTETLRKLNELDMESLNTAIRNLGEAVRPLAELARILS